MSYLVTLCQCESIIFNYFDSIIRSIDLYVNETYDGIFNNSALNVIDQLKSKMNYHIKNIEIKYVNNNLELLMTLINPLYIVSYENNNYELIEINRLYFYTQIINRNLKVFLNRYFTSKIYDIDIHINNFLIDCNEENISHVYNYLLDNKSPLIEDPNSFIKVCAREDICSLFTQIVNKEIIDYKILLNKNSGFFMSDLYKLLKKNAININSSLINIMINRCHEEDISSLYKQLLSHDVSDININKIINRFESCYIPRLLKLISIDKNIDLKTVDFILLIKRCDRDQIVQLYHVLQHNENIHNFIFSDISFATKVINNMFNRCHIDNIEDLYRLIEMKELVDVNMILNRCDRLDIIQLYCLIPNKQDVNINKLFNRCDQSEMILLYNLIPNKQDIDINNILGRCKKTDLIQFYKNDLDTTSRCRTNALDFHILFSRCNSTDVLELYRLILTNSTCGELISVNYLIDICISSDILKLCKLISNKERIDDIETLFNKCSTSDIILLYNEMKHHTDIDFCINHIISKCYPSDIIHLYENITNKDAVDVTELIERANGNYVLELYKLIPNKKTNNELFLEWPSTKKDVDVNLMFETCDSNDVLKLYQLIENKHDININNLLDRCPRINILPLFKLINKENVDINKVIDRCDYFDVLELYQHIILDVELTLQVDTNNLIRKSYSSDILELYKLIPNKDDIDVNSMIWNCSNSDILELYKLIPNKQDINIETLLIKCSEYNRLELNKLLLK